MKPLLTAEIEKLVSDNCMCLITYRDGETTELPFKSIREDCLGILNVEFMGEVRETKPIVRYDFFVSSSIYFFGTPEDSPQLASVKVGKMFAIEVGLDGEDIRNIRMMTGQK